MRGDVAFLDFNRGAVARIKEAMVAESNGREVRVEVSDYNNSASLAIRKANGWWATTMIPMSMDNLSSKDAETQMLAYMNLIPKTVNVNSVYDAVEFARLWIREHRND